MCFGSPEKWLFVFCEWLSFDSDDGSAHDVSYLASHFIRVFYHFHGCGSLGLRVDGDVAVVADCLVEFVDK